MKELLPPSYPNTIVIPILPLLDMKVWIEADAMCEMIMGNLKQEIVAIPDNVPELKSSPTSQTVRPMRKKST